jgi:hypothetical protein
MVSLLPETGVALLEPPPPQAVSARLIVRVPTIDHVPRIIQEDLIQPLPLTPHTS